MSDTSRTPSLTRRALKTTVTFLSTSMTAALAVGLVVAGSSLIADRAESVGLPDVAPPVTVTAKVLTREPGYNVIRSFVGQLEAAQQADLAFEAGGTLDEVLVEEGARVAQGEVLARMDTRVLTTERKAMQAARAALDRLYGALRDQQAAEPSPDDMAPVLAALDDDLNTPAAFAALHALAAQVHSEADQSRRAQIAAGLHQAGGLLGLLQQDPIAWAHAGAGEVDHIEALVAKRAQARADHDWQRADELRDQLLALGEEVEDTGGENRWRMRA